MPSPFQPALRDVWLGVKQVGDSAGLVVVTNNLSEFGRVPALEVENWVAGGK